MAQPEEEPVDKRCLQVCAQAAWPPTRARPGSVSSSPRLSLGPDSIHIWWIDLEGTERDASAVLSAHERARATRFRHPRDGARWTAARVALRQILAGYTGDHPADIGLAQGVCVKPALGGGSPLRFSLSHARERAVLAVAWEREDGIDLEPIDPGLDVSPLLAVVCSETEAARIDAHPPAARLEAFLAGWTLKEAFLKGTGAGLSRDPRMIEMELLPDGWTNVRDSVPDMEGPPWSVRLLDAGPGWIAAVTIAGQEPAIMVYRWP